MEHSRELQAGVPTLQIRAAQVRSNVGVLVTPLVPDVHALLEHRDVLVVGHGSTPKSCWRPKFGLQRGLARSLHLLGLKLPDRKLYAALNDPCSRGRVGIALLV